ncbi:MAG: FkbM family methyltransferase, partial [Thermoanaerobaculia bacterium]
TEGAMLALKRIVKRALRALGYDLTRYPPGDSLGAHLLAVFSRLGIDCVLDVGAHRGEYGGFLRRIGYRGWIVSFEPVAESFRALAERARRDASWRALRLALGSEDRAARINVARHSDMASFLPPSRDLPDWPGSPLVEPRGVETVEMRRLDGVLDGCLDGIPRPRIYLKLDTQGWDLEVVRGAAGCLGRVLALQSEVALRPIYRGMSGCRETIAELNLEGFEVSGLFPVARDTDLTLIEMDCVMVRTGRSAARASLAGRPGAIHGFS